MFELKTLLKLNRTGDPLSSLHVNVFQKDQRLCVCGVSYKGLYLRDKDSSASRQLLVSFIKPHKAITRDTLARWSMRVLKLVGVNTDRYASHSTHGAMASKARLLGISVKKILAHAGWKTVKSFTKHYNRLEKSNSVADLLLTNRN